MEDSVQSVEVFIQAMYLNRMYMPSNSHVFL